AERVLHGDGRSRLVQRRPCTLPRPLGNRCPGGRPAVPSTRFPGGIDGDARTEAAPAMSTPRSLALVGCAPIILSIALAAQGPDRSLPTQPGPPPSLTLPTVQKRQLSNGLSLRPVDLHEVPVVQVNLLVSRGSADDPSGRFGTASLTASMLEEGAGSRSALE